MKRKENYIDTEEEQNGKNNFKYTINGSSQQYAKRILAAKLVEEYIKMNPDLSPKQVVNNWKSLGNIVSHFVETEEEFKVEPIFQELKNQMPRQLCLCFD